MVIEVSELQSRTREVIDAVQTGERVILAVSGDPVADIVPRSRRERWLSGSWLQEQLSRRQADATLDQDLADLTGNTLESP